MKDPDYKLSDFLILGGIFFMLIVISAFIHAVYFRIEDWFYHLFK